MSHLPQDIITSILLHVPVKPLVKFRCVSKSWLSLISAPHFAKNHFLCNQTTNQRLLLACDGDSESLTLKSCSLSSLFDSPSPSTSLAVATEVVHFIEESCNHIHVIGSDNGLLCIATSYGPKPDLYLWNPTTREHRKLPAIVGFTTEDCYTVSKPPNEFDPYLVELGECLCVLAHHRNRDHVDIWMMKEYGVKESWFKMATVPYSYDQDEPWATEHHFGTSYLPLSYGKNGELLLKFQSCLVLYNPNTNAFRMPVIDNFEHCSQSFIFVET